MGNDMTLGAKIKITIGDLLTYSGDAIVNAANASLLQGSGLCGAVFRAAGAAELGIACANLGGCPTGDARTTPAFGLPCRWIIHAVAPNWHRHPPEIATALLRQTYRAIFREAQTQGIRRLAIPAIGTGIYAIPCEIANQVALAEIRAGLLANPEMEEVVLLFSEPDKLAAMQQAFAATTTPRTPTETV